MPIKTHCNYYFIQLPLKSARTGVTNPDTFVLSFLVTHVLSYCHWWFLLPQVGSCLVGRSLVRNSLFAGCGLLGWPFCLWALRTGSWYVSGWPHRGDFALDESLLSWCFRDFSLYSLNGYYGVSECELVGSFFEFLDDLYQTWGNSCHYLLRYSFQPFLLLGFSWWSCGDSWRGAHRSPRTSSFIFILFCLSFRLGNLNWPICKSADSSLLTQLWCGASCEFFISVIERFNSGIFIVFFVIMCVCLLI